jgi:hypothetical protein
MELGGCTIDLAWGAVVRNYGNCYTELYGQLIIFGVLSLVSIVALVYLIF